MKIYSEKHLSRFNFWGNAQSHADWLDESEFNTLESVLEDLYPDGIDETQLNDIMAFDFDWVCDVLDKNIDE